MRMRTRLGRLSRIVVIAGCAVLFESTSRASSSSFEFTAIDVEGATLTVASGINAGGDIVGWYVAGGKLHGFVSSGGIATPIDFPSVDPSNPVVATDARGIGPGGDIVGTYRLANEPTTVPAHGYLLTGRGRSIVWIIRSTPTPSLSGSFRMARSSAAITTPTRWIPCTG